jgi:hypothetical protein
MGDNDCRRCREGFRTGNCDGEVTAAAGNADRTAKWQLQRGERPNCNHCAKRFISGVNQLTRKELR